MLRRNPETGAWERKVGEGWEPAPAPASTGDGDLDQAIEGAFSAPVAVAEHSEVESPATEDNGVMDDLPGLVSVDGSRSSSGFKTVRERLQSLRGNGQKSRRTEKVVVGPRAAKATGPAVKDGTEARQKRQTSPRAEPGAQRYMNRPAPDVLAGRPKWQQELFEAHFRSEATLALRRAHNRMKISRQDYAIGWLTLLDKIKEDPSIARLKG